MVFALLVVGFAFPGRAYAYVAFPPGYTWDDLNSDWEDFDQKLKDRISHLWKDIGDGFSGSGGGDIDDGGSGSGTSPVEGLEGFHAVKLKAQNVPYWGDQVNKTVDVYDNPTVTVDASGAATVTGGTKNGSVTWNTLGELTMYVDDYSYNKVKDYAVIDYIKSFGSAYVIVSTGEYEYVRANDNTNSNYYVHNTSDASIRQDHFTSTATRFYRYGGEVCAFLVGAKSSFNATIAPDATASNKPLQPFWDSKGAVFEPITPEPSEPVTHEHPEYPVNDTHPDGSGDTYTYNVYDGDDVAFTVEVEGTDLSPITLRLDDLNMMFSDFANEFSWFEDTLLSLLMRMFTMQLYIYDEIADLLDGLETLDHSTDDLADLSTVERYLEDILSAVTNFADEDTGVTLMRGYLKGIFDDFEQLLQLLGDWPEYPTVEPSTVTVEPTDLDPVLTELRKIENLLKGTGVKAPVADPDESDPEKTIGMRIGEKMDQLKDRFPFSLPWDIFAILNLLRADPVAPQFDLPVIGSEESVHVDLSGWETVAAVTRGGTTLLFALGLALRSRSLLASWGGVSGD